MVADAAEATWDAYMWSYNQQQQAQLSQAQIMLSGYSIIDEAEVIDIGMSSYHAYKAASSFKAAAAYFAAPIPTVIDEGFAVGYILKGVYHLSRVKWEAIK